MTIEEETADDVVQMIDDVREELLAPTPEYAERAPAWFEELRTRLDRKLRAVQLAAAGLSSRAA